MFRSCRPILLVLGALLPAACATVHVYTADPAADGPLVTAAGDLLGVRVKLAEQPGPGVVTLEVRPTEGDMCGRALERLVHPEGPSDALAHGLIDCEPLAWSCDHPAYVAHELAHVIGLLQHTSAGLMAPAPALDAELTEWERRRVQAMAVLFVEVCR